MQGSLPGYGALRDSPTMGIFKAGSGGITPPTPGPDPGSGGLTTEDGVLITTEDGEVITTEG